MTDKIHPSAKPTTAVPSTAFPATKAQLYNASRPAYRPQPPPRRRRSRCCSCCLWTTFIISLLLLISAVTAAVFYLLYSPHLPYFVVSNLSLSKFNITSKTPPSLSSDLSLSLLARNPNKKITFLYSPFSVAVTVAGVAPAGDAQFPAFTHPTKNTTVLKTRVVSGSGEIEERDATWLRSEMKRKKRVEMKIEMNTKMRVKIGRIKTKAVRVRITCGGIRAAVPTGKKPTTAEVGGDKCKFDFRVKIWKWTV